MNNFDNPLCNPVVIRDIQNRFGFRFSKALGQNFLVDPSVPFRIVQESDVNSSVGVIEIGPGIGCLTFELCRSAGRVVAIELDESLIPVLSHTLGEFNNVTVIQGDALKLNLDEVIQNEFFSNGIKDIKVCANLPYYITTPIIMHLLESALPFSSITVMVQKEVADRLCAAPGGKDFGAITLAAQYYTKPTMLFAVPAQSFMPAPKVNSAVVRLDVLKEPPVHPVSSEKMFKVIKAAFAQRRKTLHNALSNTLSLPRDTVASAIKEAGLQENIRGERLSLADFAKLSDILFK